MPKSAGDAKLRPLLKLQLAAGALLLVLLLVFLFAPKQRPPQPPAPMPTALPTVAPTASPTPISAIPPAPLNARFAIVIDDIGYRVAEARALMRLHPHITLAVIPTAPHALALSEEAHRRGFELLIHLPMEPLVQENLDITENALLVGMSAEVMQERLDYGMRQVPHAVGVNNHMGSRFTIDATSLTVFLQLLKHYPLFVLDSRTTAESQFAALARQQAIPTLERDVFLDNQQDQKAIAAQLQQLWRKARQNGSAIAIGHPHPETIASLKAFLEADAARANCLKPLSQLLHN